VKYTLSKAATGFAADHFGADVSFVLEKLRLTHDLGQLYLRSETDEPKEASAPTKEASAATVESAPDRMREAPPDLDSALANWLSRTQTLALRAAEASRRGSATGAAEGAEPDGERIFPWEAFRLTTIEPPRGASINAASKISFRIAIASGSRSFEVTANLGDSTFTSIDRHGKLYNYGDGHIFQLLAKSSQYLSVAQGAFNTWFSPLFATKMIWMACITILLQSIVNNRGLFSITGIAPRSIERSVLPIEIFRHASENVPALEFRQDRMGRFIDWPNGSIYHDGRIWNHVTIHFNAADAFSAVRRDRLSLWEGVLVDYMTASPQDSATFRALYAVATKIDGHIDEHAFRRTWRRALKAAKTRNPAVNWPAAL
jgi:hypothetical protein